MSELRYLSRLASPGSILEWDGKKIVPSESIVATESGISISGSMSTAGDITANQFRGNFCGRYTSQDSQPLVQPGHGIEVKETDGGSFYISHVRSSSLLWKWNETDASQFELGYNTLGDVQLTVSENSWGPSLRVKVNRTIVGSDPGVLVLNLRQSNLALSGLRRYRLKFRLSGFSGNKEAWLGIGATYMSNMLFGDDLLCLGDVLVPTGSGGRILRVDNGRIKLGSYVSPGPSLDLSPLVGRCQVDIEHELTYRKSGKSLGYQSRISSGGVYCTSDELRATRDLGVSQVGCDADIHMGAGIILICDKESTKATFDIDSIRLIPHEMDS
jgi:hypothetical protein